MSVRRPLLLAVSLSLAGCAGELPMPPSAPPVASLPTAAPAAACEPAVVTTPETRREQRRRARGPGDRDFVITHFSAGVFSTLLIQPATYFVASKVGDVGHGLGPAIGALLIGAFVPPILNYTVQWAAGRKIAPGRDRFWPGFLVNQLSHLGFFVGAVVGGVDLHNLGQASALVVGEALVNSGLATMTAELTRKPRSLAAGATTEVVVPFLEVKF